MHSVLFNFIEKYLPLSEQEKDAIISLDIFNRYKKGTVLLREGQISNMGYFVLSGCLRSHYVIDGNEKTTAFYTEMEGVTPHCVLKKTPSEYYISTVEDSILLESTPDMEQEIFENLPKFEKLCRLLSEDVLSKQQIDFNEFKILNPEQRYQNLLNNRPDLIQRVPQHQLASFLGITPQSLSRLRSRIITKSN